MKKTIILIALLLSIVLTVFFLSKTNREHDEQKANYTTIPAFCLPDINNDTITEQALQKDISTLFLFFEPGCGACDTTMTEINLVKNDFSTFQLVFFTPHTPETISIYLKETGFSVGENMIFLSDQNFDLSNAMEVKASPSAFIYNSEGVLIKQFSGIVKIETLLKYLSKK